MKTIPASRRTPTVHLLHGFIGSGKTTLARQLEQELPAVRFTHDEWMVSLYGWQPPAEHYADYFARIETLIWTMVERVVRVGGDVVLDHGFWSRDSRSLARERVCSCGAVPRFYTLACPWDVMKARTLERSATPAKDSLWIDEPAFEKLKAGFEPMGSDEDFTIVDGNT